MSLRRAAAATAVSGLVALVLPAAGSPRGVAGDRQLVELVSRLLPAVEQAARAASHGRGGPDAVQAQYDAARDFEDALAGLAPVSRGCLKLLRTARMLARGGILEAEGYDRASPAVAARGASQLARSEAAFRGIRRDCSLGPVFRPPRVAQLLTPESGEPFTGRVMARGPDRTAEVELRLDGRRKATIAAHSGALGLRVVANSGRHALELRFRDRRGRLLAVQRSLGVWLLPVSARRAAKPPRDDRALDARLAALAAGFPGQAAIWVENLRSGREASWNADARFPAASTVKLAVLLAALAKLGPHPERSPAFYDIRRLTAWSSNLAANRLLRTLAGSEAAGADLAQATLARLGATASTYTGDYRVGTAVRRALDAPAPPPLASRRTTTARDLARIMSLIAEAARGSRPALHTAGLTVHEARLALGLLLDSQPTRANVGLFRPWLPPGVPLAQKNGWLSRARHTAGILYAPDGPRIAVLLTFRAAGLTRADAALLGRRVVQVALALH